MNARCLLGRKTLLMPALLLVVAGSACRPLGGDLERAATDGSEYSCKDIVDLVEGTAPDSWRQDSDGEELPAPEVEVFKRDHPPGEGHKVRTLCPDANGCDSAFGYGETVDGVVRPNGDGPAPDFLLAKATYSTPDSGAVGVYLDGWDAAGTDAPHEKWLCYPWPGEFRYSFRGFQGEGKAAVTFEFWSREAEESSEGQKHVRWKRSEAATVSMQATPNEQCHCCSACGGVGSSSGCGKTGRQSSGRCQALDSVSLGNARMKIHAGSGDPVGIAKAGQLDNGDIQFQRNGCQESVILTPMPGYLKGWSLVEEPQASNDPIRIKSHHDHRIYDFQVAPNGESWRLTGLLREDGSTEAAYEYGSDGRLERIYSGPTSSGTYLQLAYDESQRLKTVTPYVENTAVTDRARRLLYDGDRVQGIENAGCAACGSKNRLFYYDENGRLARITNRDDVDLELFSYDRRGRLIGHDRRNDQNVMVKVKTIDYEDLGQGSAGTVTIHEPLSDTQERIFVEHYDVDGRLTATDRYPALFPRGSKPRGDSLTTTTRYHTARDSLSGVTTKTTEVTNPAGVTSFSELKTFKNGLSVSLEDTSQPSDWIVPQSVFEQVATQNGEAKIVENAGPENSPVTPSYRGEGVARYLWTYTRGSGGSVTDSAIAFYAFDEAAASFLMTYRIDRRGVTELTYDASGRLATRMDPVVTLLDGAGTVRARTTYEYDEQGRRTRTGRRSAAGGAVYTDYDYDDLGRVTTQTENADALNPDLRPVTRYEYSAFGERRKVTDARGTVTETFHDAAGRVTDGIVYQRGNGGAILTQTHYDYNAAGQLDRKGTAFHTGPLVKDRSRTWSDTTYTHDLMGRILSESTPGPNGGALTTTFHYDYQGRIIEQVNPDGSVKRMIYDGLGREVERIIDGPGVAPLISKRGYDEHGRLAESISPSGVITTYAYDEFGRQTAVEEGEVLRTEHDFDANGQVVRTLITDLVSGDALSDTTFAYDELGRRIVARRRTTAGTDRDNDPIRLTVFNAEGRATANIEKADGNNDLSRYEPGDRHTQTVYDVLGRAVKTVDPVGTTTETEYDAGGMPVSRTVDPDGLSLTTSYRHDALGQPKRVIDPEGHYIALDYDSQGNIVRQMSFDCMSMPLAQTRMEYDVGGRLTRTVRMLDPASAATPDPAIDAIAEQRYYPAGARGAGRLAETIEYDGVRPRTTLTDYDGLGRPVGISPASAPATYQETEYEPDTGRIAARVSSDPLGVRRVEFEHDSADRRILVRVVGDGAEPDLETNYTYDGRGRPTRIIAPDDTETHIRYDLVGREIGRIEDATGLARATFGRYDRLDNLSVLSTNDGAVEHATRYAYDAAGRPTLIRYPDHGVDGQSGEVVQGYDAAGRLGQHTDQRGIVTRFQYDDRGLLTRRLVPTMRVDDFYAYDGLGRLTAHQRDAGHHGKRYYNGLGQLVEEQQTVGGVTKTIAFAYNPLDERTAVDYPADAATTLTYEYDALGNNTRIRRNDKSLVEYDYQGGFMANRRLLTARGKVIGTEFTYDHHRRVNGIANTTEGTNLISYAFDHDMRGSPTFSHQTSERTLTWNADYGYDTLQRLTQVDYAGAVTGNECFDYDLLGNRKHYCPRTGEQDAPTEGVFYNHNAVNEYTEIAARGVTDPVRHDSSGNLILDERGYGYLYDAENNLTRVYTDTNRSGTYDEDETIHAEYRYDAVGRRVQATIDDRTLYYYYDADNVLVEYEADDAATPYRWYVHGTTYIDEHAVMYTNDPAVGGDGTDDFYYLSGHLHNVAGLVSSRGQLVEAAQYDAYGMPTVYRLPGDTDFDGDIDRTDYRRLVYHTNSGGDAAVSSSSSPATRALPHADDGVNTGSGDVPVFLPAFTGAAGSPEFIPPPMDAFIPHPAGALNDYYFTGRRLDMLDSSSLPLQYSRARYYDLTHGRFLQRDPTHYLDGMNLYNYGRANPANNTDPLGLKASDEGPIIPPSLGTVEEIKSLHGCSCIFTINVDAYGLNYTGSAEELLQSLLDANRTREDTGVGHSWVRLEANGEVVQGGHTGMRGKNVANPDITFRWFGNMASGVLWLSILPPWAPSPMPHLKEYADPRNPAAWLHYVYNDGYWAEGSGTHQITTHECSWCLTEQQAQAIGDEISRLRESGGAALRAFGLTASQCTKTAKGIAEKGGINLDTYTTLVLPKVVRLRLLTFPRFDIGLKIRLWSTRPELSTLRFAVPDKMADKIMDWAGPEEYHKVCRP